MELDEQKGRVCGMEILQDPATPQDPGGVALNAIRTCQLFLLQPPDRREQSLNSGASA